MQELCLAIALVAAAVGGLEYVATVAVSWATALVQADDLEDMLDLDLDRPDLELDLDFESEPEEDSETPSSSPAAAPTERRGL